MLTRQTTVYLQLKVSRAWGVLARVTAASRKSEGASVCVASEINGVSPEALNYGACEEGEDAALAIANDIVTQLEAHGLRTDWNGSWSQRIGVSLDWKRRRQEQPPLFRD